MAEISTIGFREIAKERRFDSEYFRPSIRSFVARLREMGGMSLRGFVREAKRGQAPEYASDGTIKVIRTVNVRDLEFSETRQEYVTETFFNRAQTGRVAKNDIVVTSTGIGTLGRTFCNTTNEVFFADGHITVLKLVRNVDYALLTSVLQSKIGTLQFEQRQRGSSGQVEIYPDDILDIWIPNLPENVRAEISRMWKQAVGKVEASRSYYPDAEKELLDRIGWQMLALRQPELSYIASIGEIQLRGRFDAEHFQPMYERLRSHLNKGGATTIGELTVSVAKGMQPARYIDDGEVIVVKSKNVIGQGIDFQSCERTSLDAYGAVNARLTENDVVINSTGLGTLGRAAFVPKVNLKVVAAVDLLIYRFDRSFVLPQYATLFLNSPAGLMQSEQFQTGSSGQLHLYPQHLKQILIFIPRNRDGSVDLDWQRRLASKIIAVTQSMRDAREIHGSAIKLVEDSIL